MTAIVDSDYNHCSWCVEFKKHAPLPNAEPELPYPALKLLNVTMTGCGKSFQSSSDALLCDAVEPVKIAKRRRTELNRSHLQAVAALNFLKRD